MFKKFLFLSTLLGCCYSAQAGVVLGGTRVIYDEGKKEVPVDIENKGNVPYLIQNQSDDFLITPPLFRLDGDKKNALRIFKLEKPLPNDRESIFFLNVKSIPGGALDGNTLQIAIRNRLKLIYRPTILQKETPESQTNKLSWSISGNSLKLRNPTPYYQNFMFIKIDGKDIDLKNNNYASPFSEMVFDISGKRGKKVSWKIINDYGSIGPLHMSDL